jgi:hypothetical protein
MRACLLVVFLCGPLMAAVYKPYPDAAISVAQWQAYFDIIQEEFGSTREEIPDADLVVFHDEISLTQYATRQPSTPCLGHAQGRRTN